MNIVIPSLVADPESESALRPLPPELQRTVESSQIVRLAPLPPSATPEAAYLALDPGVAQVAQGPLMVAAFGHRPPERSVHFHLTLASVSESAVLALVPEPPSDDELRVLCGAIERLRTPRLTPLCCDGIDHALVWEDGSLDLATTTPEDAYGHELHSKLPQGEGEELLRRFVDDSVNLLNGLERNHVRREEGLPPLNCLWPWGQGLRPELPNLPLRRGDVAHVVSGSVRMQGLCRLVGYSHGDRSKFGRGLQTSYDLIRQNALSHTLSLSVVQSITEMQAHGRVDEIAWNLERLSSLVIEPLLGMDSPFELRIAAPGDGVRLGLLYMSERKVENGFPFDERAIDDPRLSLVHTWEFLHPGFLGES